MIVGIGETHTWRLPLWIDAPPIGGPDLHPHLVLSEQWLGALSMGIEHRPVDGTVYDAYEKHNMVWIPRIGNDDTRPWDDTHVIVSARDEQEVRLDPDALTALSRLTAQADARWTVEYKDPTRARESAVAAIAVTEGVTELPIDLVMRQGDVGTYWDTVSNQILVATGVELIALRSVGEQPEVLTPAPVAAGVS